MDRGIFPFLYYYFTVAVHTFGKGDTVAQPQSFTVLARPLSCANHFERNMEVLKQFERHTTDPRNALHPLPCFGEGI